MGTVVGIVAACVVGTIVGVLLADPGGRLRDRETWNMVLTYPRRLIKAHVYGIYSVKHRAPSRRRQILQQTLFLLVHPYGR